MSIRCVPAPDERPYNDCNAATDAAENVVEQFAALQPARHDANRNVPSTVGCALRLLSGLVKNPRRDEAAVFRLNSELNEEVDMREEAEPSLASRGLDLARSGAESTRLTCELQKAAHGLQAAENSLEAR